MELIRDLKNELMRRYEVKLVVKADKNPGMKEAARMISEKFKAPQDAIAIKELKSKFGRDTFLIDAFIYKSKEDKEKMEPKKKVKKKEGEAGGAK